MTCPTCQGTTTRLMRIYTRVRTGLWEAYGFKRGTRITRKAFRCRVCKSRWFEKA